AATEHAHIAALDPAYRVAPGHDLAPDRATFRLETADDEWIRHERAVDLETGPVPQPNMGAVRVGPSERVRDAGKEAAPTCADEDSRVLLQPPVVVPRVREDAVRCRFDVMVDEADLFDSMDAARLEHERPRAVSRPLLTQPHVHVAVAPAVLNRLERSRREIAPVCAQRELGPAEAEARTGVAHAGTSSVGRSTRPTMRWSSGPNAVGTPRPAS